MMELVATTATNSRRAHYHRRLFTFFFDRCIYFFSQSRRTTTSLQHNYMSSVENKQRRRKRKLLRTVTMLGCWITIICIMILRAGGGGLSSYSSYSLDPINLEILMNGTSTTSSSYQNNQNNNNNHNNNNHNNNNILRTDHPSALPPPSFSNGAGSSGNTITNSAATTINNNKINDDNNNIGISSMLNLPTWMREYMNWHRQQIHKLNLGKKQWKDQPILIVRCLQQDRCGGTSDRLKSFPLFVLIAAKTSRLIFIRWSRPFQLEEFLIPGHALNWTIPTELQYLIDNTTTNSSNHHNYFEGKDVKKMIIAATDTSSTNNNNWLIEGNIQYSGGQLYTNLVIPYQKSKNLKVEDYDYTTYYHDFFHNVFQLSPNIQKLWSNHNQEQQQHQLDDILLLKPNQYVVAHYRAKYPKEPYLESGKNSTILKSTIINAIECAISTTTTKTGRHRATTTTTTTPPLSNAAATSSSSSTTTTPAVVVYVASDTILAIELAKEHYNQQNAATGGGGEKIYIVSHLDIMSPSSSSSSSTLEQQQLKNKRNNNSTTSSIAAVVNEDPPHLNFANRTSPSSFYSIFIDLWAMHQSSCVSFGAGGFGRFGSLVSFNMSCRVAHSIKGKIQSC